MSLVMNPVRQSFNRAAATYITEATLQQQVAHALTSLVDQELPSDFSGTLLDAGCGTGYCLEHLIPAYKDARFIALDFAERMLQQLPGDLHAARLSADLQHLPLATASIDVYLSSLAWQWCDAQSAAREAVRTLRPGGELFITTLVHGTFKELAHSLAEIGINPDLHLLPCATPTVIESAICSAGTTILSTTVNQITTWHKDFKALRYSIRGVGANHLPKSSTPAFNRQTRSALIAAYERMRTPRGLPLTYDVLTIHARKVY